jgi:hypothetical protein
VCYSFLCLKVDPFILIQAMLPGQFMIGNVWVCLQALACLEERSAFLIKKTDRIRLHSSPYKGLRCGV